MKMNKTREITFMAFYVALGIILNYVSEFFPRMPNGGTFDVYIIAIFIASFHLGWKKGSVVAMLVWLLGLLLGMNNYMISIPQVLTDYILPVLAIGIAAIFPKITFGKIVISNIYVGIICSIVLKYVSHVVAGAIFWFPESGGAAGSIEAWQFSLGYNFAYNAINLIGALCLVPILIVALSKISSIYFVGVKK